MNKEWFVFKGTHHQGPFTLEEMELFYCAGEINSHSLVWKEGQEQWEALSKIRELSFADGPSELPNLPELPENADDELPELPRELPKKLGKGPLEELPPPVPLDAILNPNGPERDVFAKNKGVVLFQKNQWIMFGLLTFLFIAVLGWFFMNENSSSVQLRVKGVMPVNLEKLQEVATQKSPFIAMTMTLSHDGKVLYASTNKSGEIDVIIKMQSVKDRILGAGEVSLVIKDKINNHLGSFTRIRLTQGKQFIPGEYQINLVGRKLHFLNEKFKFLNQIDFFKSLNSNYLYETRTLIYAGTPREFEKKLLEYQDRVINEKLRPYAEKLERMQTFHSLVNKTMEQYLLVLEKIKRPKEIVEFENFFSKEISPILQSLVTEADELSKKENVPETNPANQIATFQNQVEFGKQLGEMASAMIIRTEAQKSLTVMVKNALKNKFENIYKNIKTQLDGEIKKLEEKIQGLSKK